MKHFTRLATSAGVVAGVGARVVYLPYTPSTSSTKLRRFIAPEDFSDEASADKSDKATEGEQQ